MLRAFGLIGAPVRLAGGRGTSWRVGDAILKPLDVAEDELAWRADLHERIGRDGFRLAAPLRSTDGALVVDGWTAHAAVDGRHEAGRWADVIAVGERFHAALAGFERPDFIDRRTNAWAVADRVAWGEAPAPVEARLLAALRPVHAPSQLIHGDLTGNVLFAEHLLPAILDFSPYWRPPPYAAAVVVADSLVWEGADASVLDAVGHIEDFPQYLLRALIFRLTVARLLGDHESRFAGPVDLALRLTRG